MCRMALLCCGLLTSVVGTDDTAKRWEPQIAAFEKADSKDPPPKDAILFVGSSSIRGWKLKKYFPELKTINRGFGGSQMSDSLHYADRIVIPHRPKAIVVYAGDNDIAKGKSPEVVARDYQAFVKKVRGELPNVRVLFIAIKPSLKRWKLIEDIRKANKMISKLTSEDPLQEFIDIDTPMLGGDGKPRKELFVKDGLHLSHAGYVLWSNATVAAINKKPVKASAKKLE